MPTFREISGWLLAGAMTTSEPKGHPFARMNQLEEVAEGVAFYKDSSNFAAVRTAEGLVLMDTGSFAPAAREQAFAKLRGWSTERIHTAIYSHGHVDHAYGLDPYLKEGAAKKWPAPAIVAHENAPARFERYALTAGYNSAINSRQFGRTIIWPPKPPAPTITYTSRLRLLIGGVQFWLEHAKGETDDHTWIFLPHNKVLYTGDLFIWAAPNAGNPQKVQRYALEWAQALRAMAKLEPELLLPGHGVPIFGAGAARVALEETAEYLESLHRQTIEKMNEGARLEDILRTVAVPGRLKNRPYLAPVYDEPEFIVRNIYRRYGGWYSGIPSELKPAPFAEVGREVAALAGGLDRLANRAMELAVDGNTRLACHLIDWATEAAPTDPELQKQRAEIYRRRAAGETSTMAKGIFTDAARAAAALS